MKYPTKSEILSLSKLVQHNNNPNDTVHFLRHPGNDRPRELSNFLRERIFKDLYNLNELSNIEQKNNKTSNSGTEIEIDTNTGR